MELVEYQILPEKKLVSSPKLDGFNKQLLYKKLCDDFDTKTATSMIANGYSTLRFFSDPNEFEHSNVLCIGKVQSGKTTFFTVEIALAFDNGYKITYLFAGTKNKLKSQSETRIEQDFRNNRNIVVKQINDLSAEEIRNYISEGKNVIAIVLKNAAKKKNLGKMLSIEEQLHDIPSLIVDDEADEVTPGAPAKKNKGVGGKTHQQIADIINKLDCCTYLSVTATPQANLLLSQYDELSPDYVSLVKPGNGYTGGNSFHDTMDNPHVIEISDADNFDSGIIPESFKNAFYDYVFSCCLKNDNKRYSMLVHPSSYNAIQNQVANTIVLYIKQIIKNLTTVGTYDYQASLEELYKAINRYETINKINVDKKYVESRIPFVLKNINTFIYNVSVIGRLSSLEENNSTSLYNVYVGGNMLGRGLTLPNLITTYIYRDSKVTAIDTLYQRARWLGYKDCYFDVCKVYMTRQLKEKFIATVESENDMWNAIESFLETHVNFKQFPRLLLLNYQNTPESKLILTRESITKTIEIDRVDPGFNYDKSIDYKSITDRTVNRDLYKSFYDKYHSVGHEEQLGKGSHSEPSFVIDMPFSDFYSDFLSKYQYPLDSKFGIGKFKKILNDVSDNKRENIIKVVIMRYKNREYRSLSNNWGFEINELLQGRSADCVSYVGDKNIFPNEFHIQIHLVYQDDKDDFVPMLAMRNPVTVQQARYVTGGTYSDEIHN